MSNDPRNDAKIVIVAIVLIIAARAIAASIQILL